MKNTGISIYGVANQTIKQSKYTYPQRKRITYTKQNGKTVSYLRKTGKTIIVESHIRNLKEKETRFTFYGTPEDCQKAKELMMQKGFVPKKQYADQIPCRTYTTKPRIDVLGKKIRSKTIKGFLDFPEHYAHSGKWSKKETKAS